MKRDIIIIEDKTVSITGNEVWMTAGEIAEEFHATVPAVNAAIKAVRKSDVLNDYEVCRYIQLENGLYADVYSLEIIIPVAFRLPVISRKGNPFTKQANCSSICFSLIPLSASNSKSFAFNIVYLFN